MKIRAIKSTQYETRLFNKNNNVKLNNTNNYCTNIDLNCIPYYEPVSFGARQNVAKLRQLFEYNLPCIYTGIPTISPKLLSKWLKSGTFNKSVTEILNIIEPYSKNFTDMEAKFVDVLTENALIYPNKTMQQIVQNLIPIYKRRLDKKQYYVFKELNELSHYLPDKYRYKYSQFMQLTKDKINETPVAIPFSSYEFKYKVEKIKSLIIMGQDLKAKKVINKILKEANKLNNSTNSNTIEHQKHIIDFINIILKKSVLKNNKQLKTLIREAKSRLNKEKTIIKFSRKSFLYDLNTVLDTLPNRDLAEAMIQTGEKLPTSSQSFSAYIMKHSHDTNEQLGHRLIWPYIASIEHLFPRSCGGLDILSNTAVATTRANSQRSNIDFCSQLKRNPLTPLYCQKNIDKHIELYHNGIYSKIGLSPTYITDLSKTYYELSRHKIKIDLSKL